MRLDGRPVVTVFLYALLYKSSSVRVAGALLLCLHGRQMNIYCLSAAQNVLLLVTAPCMEPRS